jgi:hypothetical protein
MIESSHCVYVYRYKLKDKIAMFEDDLAQTEETIDNLQGWVFGLYRPCGGCLVCTGCVVGVWSVQAVWWVIYSI